MRMPIKELVLKRIKIYKRLSQETTAYTATIYINGKKVGMAENRGEGGPDNWYVDGYAYEEVTDFVMAECDRLSLWDCGDFKLDPDRSSALDIYFGHLIEEHEKGKWMQRRTRKAVLFRLKGDEAETYRQYAVMSNGERRRVAAMIREKHGDKVEAIHGGGE